MKIKVGLKYEAIEPLGNVHIFGGRDWAVLDLNYPKGSAVVITEYNLYVEGSIIRAKFQDGNEWAFSEGNFRKWFKEVK